MSFVDDIEKLDGLRQRGAISEREYREAKETILAGNRPCERKPEQVVDKVDTDTWGMFIHLSQFCSFIVPLAGLVVPIVLWQVRKKDSDIIDRHGKIVVNWIITEFILAVVFAFLCIIFIGIPLLIALGVVGVVFPIIGAVKANNGEVWVYPCSIKFFKLT